MGCRYGNFRGSLRHWFCIVPGRRIWHLRRLIFKSAYRRVKI